MKRRNAIKLVAGTIAAGAAGVTILTQAFKPEKGPAISPKKVEANTAETEWNYTILDPATTAAHAYENFNIGSCMYGVFSSIIAQLGEKIGAPYTSFPVHMMKYGHGGIGGTGTICGSLNGATAIFGLLIDDKKIRDILTSEILCWYEMNPFPTFKPVEPTFDFTPNTSISESVLCHASAAKWVKKTGYRIDSKERVERCRRLTADVTAHTVEMLNSYFDNTFVTHYQNNETVNECMACHGGHGKLGNSTGKMNCTSCHDKTVGHSLFGDVHYQMMDKK
ncbi:hypothetical protein BZG02_09710 [Labilibaculum filiforme]|uniref:C_GCAxxG_C_C family protein n=1 Tax=Labilibaculum filiforme TaxID=1940526 RepID=A0A2N3HY99_9BACT|nr:C-GCAxxG-C-C family (seleno)protein [Labilibaculum filiforme]PKQ63038.1 hypothetical protein BZG02_09710 [Labilibaculum filiforme]